MTYAISVAPVAARRLRTFDPLDQLVHQLPEPLVVVDLDPRLHQLRAGA